MNETTAAIIQYACLAMMSIAILGILYRSTFGKKGIGARVIQFVAVVLIIPTILILSVREILNPETIATLIGGLLGYLLSGIANYDKNDTKSGQ